MVLAETSFPRGGTVKKPVETTNIVFGARQDRKKHHKKREEHKEETRNEEKVEEIKAVSANLLNHKTIQEGMILMGSVKVVEPVFLKVSLPGRILGRVVASKISDSYTKVLNKYVEGSENIDRFQPLNEMYQVGQTVYAKVIEIKENENGLLEVNLSLKPSDVHGHMFHENMHKGMLFNGAVEEIQEHGYVIETGIKNLRCFLPMEKGKPDYSVGQLVFMKIEKFTQSPTASTAICKAITGENRKIKDFAEPNLDYIVPSTVVHFTVEKVLKDGLQGTIMNGTFKGYINEHQLHEPLAKPGDFEVNSVLNARVLYIMPLTKLVYLSLNLNLVRSDHKAYQKGDIIENAKVQGIGTGGIILDLDGKSKGLISFKSIKTNFVGNYDQDEILSKYSKSTELKVRVVDFDQMDALYICTDNPSIINEKFYTVADLKPGDFVTATILEKDKNGGYIFSVGNVRGLAEKIFLSSASLNLPENSRLHCRVMAINPKTKIVYLTNRPEYMSKKCKLLTQLSKAKERSIFTGTIVKVDDKFLIVKFFNNIKGILFKSKIRGFMSGEVSSFYEGQTMAFRIVRRNEENIILGLADDAYRVGDICSAKVSSIIENGLDVAINDENQTKVLVPTRLLSDFPELVNVHLKNFKAGDDVEIACIVKNVFSLRDVPHFKSELLKNWRLIQAGDIIRGYIKNVEDDIVYIFLPIQGYSKLVKVHMKMFVEKVVENANITVYPDQVVYVKVLSKEVVTRNLTLSARLADVWDCSLKSTANIFAKYLDELNAIKTAFKTQENPIGNIDLGENIPGKVIGYDDESKDWLVELRDNVRGIIKSTFTGKKTTEIGSKLQCTVLWIDYLNEVVYLSHRAGERDHITNDANLPESYSKNSNVLNGKILIKTNDVIVCSLKKGQNPLVMVPTRLHYNDFEQVIGSGVKEGEFCRLILIHDKYPIAVFESTWKFWKSANSRKRKHSTTDEDLHGKYVKRNKPLISMHEMSPGFPVCKVRIAMDTSDEDEDDDDFKHIFEKYEQEEETNEINNLSGLSTCVDTELGQKKKRKLTDPQSSTIKNENLETLMPEMTPRFPVCKVRIPMDTSDEDEDDDDEFIYSDTETGQKKKIKRIDPKIEAKTNENLESFMPKVSPRFPVCKVRIAMDSSAEEDDDDDENIEDEEETGKVNNLKGLPSHIDTEPTQRKKRKRTESSGNAATDENSEEEIVEDEKKVMKNEQKILEDFKREILVEEKRYKAEHRPDAAKPVLPGASGFWSNDLETVHSRENDDENSSDDEDTTKTVENKKKKKLTPAERLQAAREEEARLREIEEKYANPNLKPETADQFDRLVLSNPNNSKTWIEYMVFHLTATEIDKARTVARKALKSINFREEQELINIWVALLNLELRYGNKASFDETLKESLLCNDPYKIYTRVMEILADAQKTQELIEIITTVTRKFKDKPDTWKIAANAYFEIGMSGKAQQLLHKALASLPERDHINTIVTFANLNHKHGDKETAHTLFEQVLTSYPKRVDVWSQYVDMLIKDQEIESARRTLERAVVQKIPLKKMRTLFKKYLDFEERYGSEEDVQKVKEMAANYVRKEIIS